MYLRTFGFPPECDDRIKIKTFSSIISPPSTQIIFCFSLSSPPPDHHGEIAQNEPVHLLLHSISETRSFGKSIPPHLRVGSPVNVDVFFEVGVMTTTVGLEPCHRLWLC